MSVATRVDEVLKYLWLKEEGWQTEELRPVLAYNLRREDFEEAARRGWLEEQNGEWVFTPEGRQEASTLIRRMRLAEWLFTEVVKDPRSAEVAACRLEHVLTDEAADQICTLLGHPRTCPHGRPIPQGACCVEHRMVVRPLSLPVTHLEAGEWGPSYPGHLWPPSREGCPSCEEEARNRGSGGPHHPGGGPGRRGGDLCAPGSPGRPVSPSLPGALSASWPNPPDEGTFRRRL